MRRCLLLLLLFPFVSVAQSVSTADDFRFVNYLIGNSLKDDAVILLKERVGDGDSISFLKGYTYYSVKQLDSAIRYFSEIKPLSSLYDESRFWGALSSAHNKQYCDAQGFLASIGTSADTALLGLSRFEQAGISLLQRDYKSFDSCYARLNTADYRYSTEAAALSGIRQQLPAHRKSPLLAASLSAVVPGLGKVYAGNIGEGIAAFLTVGSFGAIAAENAYREGWTNWKTLLFGSIAAVFYIGNIYGSAVTVRVITNNIEQQNDVQILYNIHIPIRNTFRH